MVNIMKKLFCYIKQFYYRLKGNRIGQQVYFNRGTKFENNVNFEGKTKLIDCNIGTGVDMGTGNSWFGCKIGRYCVIGGNCKNIVGHHPTTFYVAMNSKFYSPRKDGFVNERLYWDDYKYADKEKKYYNIIGNDVYITSDVILLEGVKIGDGAVITPGSVVTKNVPPYAIVRGNPAKIVTYRFREDDIQFLLKLKWWEKDVNWIRLHVNNFSNIKKLRKQIEEEKLI